MADELNPSRIPTGVLAEILGVTEKTVYNLKTQGILPESGKGKFDLATAVQSYVRYIADGRVNSSRAESEAIIAAEKAKAAIRENLVEERRLVAIEDVALLFNSSMIEIRTNVESIAGRCAPKWAQITDQAILRTLILQESRAALIEVAEGLTRYCDIEERSQNPETAPAARPRRVGKSRAKTPSNGG